MKAPAQRIQNLPANFFAGLEARIESLQRAGYDVIRLDIGSPDLPPPTEIIKALAISAERANAHGYQPHRGTTALRHAWADMYRRLYAVDIDPENEIVPLLGSKEGIFNFIMAWAGPGDVVLAPDPGYMTYTRAALVAGAEVYSLPLLKERGYLPDLESIPVDILKRAKMLWLNYPNNPTAAVAELDFFTQAVAFASKNDLWLCHDAAYTQVTYDGYRAPSILEIHGAKEVAVEFNSLSKSHNMAGWRVGAAVGNSTALKPLFLLKSNLDSSHFLAVMEAAVTAMTGDQSWLTERNEIYRQRRDIVLQGLSQLGWEVTPPKASIYVWSSVPAGWDCLDFTQEILERTHVSLTPGTVFGARGVGHVRLSLTTNRLEEAMHRLAKWRQE